MGVGGGGVGINNLCVAFNSLYQVTICLAKQAVILCAYILSVAPFLQSFYHGMLVDKLESVQALFV